MMTKAMPTDNSAKVHGGLPAGARPRAIGHVSGDVRPLRRTSGLGASPPRQTTDRRNSPGRAAPGYGAAPPAPTTTWTTSICTGSIYLAAAGILEDQDATTHWIRASELERRGAHYIQQRVVQNGKVITAAGVSAGIDMALTLLARIHGPQIAQGVQLAIEYDPQPPFDAGSPSRA